MGRRGTLTPSSPLVLSCYQPTAQREKRMREAAVSGSYREETDLEFREGEEEAEAVNKVDCSATAVRCYKFLPRMVLRVLLVESDDSTRQIIAALLRKCGYKVAAVGDGLKAWELLKRKPRSIDLILAEVDLPSVSGFALLTLIMEHNIRKSAPVIMMSSNDSVSTAYKCMLRGAADFLVKPVRINELRNLWQHVWRRQASGKSRPQDSIAKQKVEITAENNAVTTPSSSYVARVQRNKECSEKGSDAQSSCTKPDMEVENSCAENTYTLSETKKSKSPEVDPNAQEVEECINANGTPLVYDNVDTEMLVGRGEDVNTAIHNNNVATDSEGKNANVLSEVHDNNEAFINTSREAIDFIGAFSDHPTCNFRSSSLSNGNKKFDSLPLLDLSLRGSHPTGSVNQVSEERQALNHSDSSAFLRYVYRVPPLLHSPASICNQTISDRHFPDQAFNYNIGTHSSPVSSQKTTLSSATGQSHEAGVTFPICQQTVISIPVPIRGLGVDGMSPIYVSTLSPLACQETEISPVQSPGPACQPSILETRSSQPVYNSTDQNFSDSTKQAENCQKRKLDPCEDQRHLSSATDQSARSSFCHGTPGKWNSPGCINNGIVDQRAIGSPVAESGKNEDHTLFCTTYQRSAQREAALTKFRLKRKERCFEKKVRYERRKKLAEQRPRFKGQFVRQMPAWVETDSQLRQLTR